MVHACADGSPQHEQQTETKPAKPSQPDASPGQRPHTTVLTTTSERPRRSNCQQQAGNLQTGRTPRRRTKKRWDTSNTGGGEGPNEHVRGPSGIWKLRSAHPKSPNPDPGPDLVARSRAPSPGLDRISGGRGDRRFGDGEISPRFGPGWVGLVGAGEPWRRRRRPPPPPPRRARSISRPGRSGYVCLLPVGCEKCRPWSHAIANC